MEPRIDMLKNHFTTSLVVFVTILLLIGPIAQLCEVALIALLSNSSIELIS